MQITYLVGTERRVKEKEKKTEGYAQQDTSGFFRANIYLKPTEYATKLRVLRT